MKRNWNPFILFCKTFKRIGSEIRKLRVFEDIDYAFGDRKTTGARSCCIPEPQALKGLKKGKTLKEIAVIRI